jgi:putative endonuclease
MSWREERRVERQARGRRAREEGRFAEGLAAAFLMLQGYQILGFRLRTPEGEVDLLARRGRVLAVVEVKRRATIAEARECVTTFQRERLLRAAHALAARRPALRGLTPRVDLVALAPGTIPRHFRDVFAA